MSESIARVRIELEDTDPVVWRSSELPLSTTLATLHDLIQIAMRWQDYHLHEFVVGEKIYGVTYPVPGLVERKLYQSKGIRTVNCGAPDHRKTMRQAWNLDGSSDVVGSSVSRLGMPEPRAAPKPLAMSAR